MGRRAKRKKSRMSMFFNVMLPTLDSSAPRLSKRQRRLLLAEKRRDYLRTQEINTILSILDDPLHHGTE